MLIRASTDAVDLQAAAASIMATSGGHDRERRLGLNHRHQTRPAD